MGLIDVFVTALPVEEQAAVQRIFDAARRIAPTAEEGVSYGLPCLKVAGKGLVAVQRSATQLSLVPFSSETVATVKESVPGLTGTKGMLRFSVADPLSDEALDAVLRTRLAEIAG